MNKLSQEKRNQLVLVALATAVVIAGLWYGLIRMEQSALRARADMIAQMQLKVKTARLRAAQADDFKARLAAAMEKLHDLEDQMATGDVWLWIIKTLQKFEAPYQVEIPNFDQPQFGELATLPKVPYKTATFSVLGTARYHEFEFFLANLEAAFPCIRVQKMELDPIAYGRAGGGEDEEKLTFKMELTTLIKPAAAHP
ncbi:MAG: hypothetical protein ACYDH9_13525 [Limisphaerales bacterium]